MAARLILTLLFLLVHMGPVKAAAKQNDEAANQRRFEFGGEYEVILDNQNRFFLGERKHDNFLRLDQELQLRTSYRHNEWISLLVEAKVLGESELYVEGGSKNNIFWLERGESWIRLDNVFNRELSLQIGRQNFEEPRRWWWDDDLDSVRLRYRPHPWLIEFGASQDFVPTSTRENFVDPEEKGVFRLLGRLEWWYRENHSLALFSLYQNDRSPTPVVGSLVKRNREDPSDAHLLWGGLRAMGRTALADIGELFYWADTAMVAGKEKLLEFDTAGGGYERVVSRQRRRVLGWAIDLGGRWTTELALRPTFILGYAVGSGDPNPEKGSDRSFRQTGLQSNDEQFRTYGELLRPELSNLSIPVLAVQFPLFSNSHVELAYRRFRQIYAAPFIREGRIETDPNGVRKNIGQEWMVYFGIKEWKDTEVELVGAVFRAGNAYGSSSGQRAYSLFLKMTYEF